MNWLVKWWPALWKELERHVRWMAWLPANWAETRLCPGWQAMLGATQIAVTCFEVSCPSLHRHPPQRDLQTWTFARMLHQGCLAAAMVVVEHLQLGEMALMGMNLTPGLQKRLVADEVNSAVQV